MTGRETFFWSEHDLAQAQAMWAKGLSARQIGAALGRPRNSICGLAHRRRDLFPARVTTFRSTGTVATRKPARPHAAPRKQSAPNPAGSGGIPADEPFVEIVDALFVSAHQVSFLAVRDSQCKWPLWGADGRPGADSLCCGTDVVAGKSWCRHHLRLAVDRKVAA